jgi:hypothetical protein
MPLEVRIDLENRVIFVDGKGIVTDADFLWYIKEYLAGASEYRTFDELFDLSEADLLDVTYDGLASVAAAAAATDPEADPTKIAILVSEARGLGLSRWYQSRRESQGGSRLTRVFWDEAECREWLGIPS